MAIPDLTRIGDWAWRRRSPTAGSVALIRLLKHKIARVERDIADALAAHNTVDTPSRATLQCHLAASVDIAKVTQSCKPTR